MMQDVKCVLIDIDGVVHQRGVSIPGSLDAIARLQRSGLDFCFLTNTTSVPHREIVGQLAALGIVTAAWRVFTPAFSARLLIEERGLDPYLLVRSALLEDFSGLQTGGKPAVVIGDALDEFSYHRLNTAFRLLEDGAEFLALAPNRYFRDSDGKLSLDGGAFVAALEYATGRKADVAGKPSANFFCSTVARMGHRPAQSVMIGDDAEFDVSAAINAGLRGILVRTGKYKPFAEANAEPKPTVVCADLAAAVDLIMSDRTVARQSA